MFPNLHLQQPKWTSVSVWNWSRKSMGCVMRSEDYLSLSENLLKYPKTSCQGPEDTFLGQRERGGPLQLIRNERLLCEGSKHTLCLYFERPSVSLPTGQCIIFLFFIFLWWCVQHCTSLPPYLCGTPADGSCFRVMLPWQATACIFVLL